MTLFDFPVQKIFCIGIGGISVSGLAELLHHEGYQVSGSDLSENEQTTHLKSLGMSVVHTHDAKHISDADLVVYSSAVSKKNPELQAAQKNNIPIILRGELLAKMMRAKNNIVIAGTHGKTTTTSLIAFMLEKADVNPTFMIGGVLGDRTSSVRSGSTEFFVAESDESDASFLFLSPTLLVITNIDADHLETYDHNFEKLKNCFIELTQKIPPHGLVIACLDDPVIQALLPKITCRVLTYGQHKEADYQLQHFQQTGLQSQFTIKTPSQEFIHLKLNLPGLHNALNTMAAWIIAEQYHLSREKVLSAFEHFPGVGRRFCYHGKISLRQGHALLFDDYGHHPLEIQVTLHAAKSAWPNHRIVLVFQPHRYTRTRDLMKEFVAVLKTADQLILTEVYAASEPKIPNADGKTLFQAIQAAGNQTARFVPLLSELPALLETLLLPNDIVILQGAGNIVTMTTALINLNNQSYHDKSAKHSTENA